MPSTHLACSVRGCGLPLARRDSAFVCPAGHSYDLARSGYVNLLQPQDRRSPDAGDSRAAVNARTRLLAAGVGRALIDEVVRQSAALNRANHLLVVDLGSGTGDLLAALGVRRPIDAIGIDLSTAAAGIAARRFPGITWVVANADRRLPLLDGRVDLVLSLHGRRNPAECARVLSPAGFLLIAVPAEDDLVELRERIQGLGIARKRGESLLEAHKPHFTAVRQFTVRDRVPLEREPMIDLLRTTYRGGRTSERDRVAALSRVTVTLASDVFLFARR